MSASRLFFSRAGEELSYQWRVLRSVLDWTIVVYFVIPVLIAAPFLYEDIWQNHHLYWSDKLPYALLFIIALLLSSPGNFRTYLMEADLLHLIQKKALLDPLKRSGFFLSFFGAFLRVFVIFILLLPLFFGVYGLNVHELVSLYLAACSFRLLFLTIKKVFVRNWSKTSLFFILLILIVTLSVNAKPLVTGLVSLFVIGAVFIHHLSQIANTNRWFLKEIEIENRERVRFIKLIMNFSMEVEKEPVNQRNQPLIFWRGSRRIFKKRSKENGVLDLLMKGFLRRNYLMSYLQITGITVSAIIVLPVWIKWVVFLGFAFFIRSWLKSVFRKMMESPFFEIIPYDKEVSESAWLRFNKVLSYPVICLAGVLSAVFTIGELWSRFG
jgi:ABC-2 type transport system permease protein